MAATDETLTMRPQRVRSMGSTSGCVTRKKPCSDTSITRCHCAGFMPGNTASSWMPALLTTICTGAAGQHLRGGHGCGGGASSVMSNRRHFGAAAGGVIASASACKASGRELACSSTCAPSAASRRAMALPSAPLAPVTRARLPCRGFMVSGCSGVSSITVARPSTSGAAGFVVQRKAVQRLAARRRPGVLALTRRSPGHVVQPRHVQAHAACAGQEAGPAAHPAWR
jgi:hypothetical protein